MTRIDAAWLTRQETQAVFAALAARGIEARAVGGAVRNALIGKAASDIDLATPATPEAVMAAATDAGFGVVPTGLQHGTVTVMSAGIPFEVTTLRRDVETDGRHAVVAFTTDWAADAARRDFTINALYCDADGRVYDPLGGGIADLDARRVRFIGAAEARIREDYLRILRFFRFTAEYAAGAPDPVGLEACSRLRDGMQRLSAERIRTEVLKLLVAPRAADIAQIMFEHGYWAALLRRVPRPQHLARRIHCDRVRGRAPDALERLASLAAMTSDDAQQLATGLRLSRADRETLEVAAQLAPALSIRCSQHELRVALYRYGRHHVVFAAAVAESRAQDDWSALAQRIAGLEVPALPVRGQDLLDLGKAPGREVGEALRRLEARWIASDFTLSRAQLLAAPTSD